MKKLDALLRKVESFERLAVYGDRKSFLQALSQQAETWSDVARQEGDLPESHSIPAPSAEKPSDVPEVSVDSLPKATPATSAGPSISPQDLFKVQNYLNKDMVNDWPPVTPDYKWGPETAKMLLQWGKKNKLNFGVQQLLDLAKSKALGAERANKIQTGPNLQSMQ
jgi:hypothetical protein